jgi:diacylglycerol O-acyltransferase / wax synthase
VPGPQVPLYALGRKVLAAHPSPPVFPIGARMAVACFSYNGTLHFGLIADYSTVPDLHVLRDGIRAGLDELLEAGPAATA